MSESVILCEGYHDRAFWTGWLKHLGCTDPGVPSSGSSRRRDIFDPWNDKVVGGQYAFNSVSGRFLRIVPCGGKSQILPVARNRLNQRTRKQLLRLIINVDADTTATGTNTKTGLRSQDVFAFVQSFVPKATLNANGEIELDGGQTFVNLVRWEVPDPPEPALPDEQTLERLACATIAGAYPARRPAIVAWLGSRPNPPTLGPKDHAWSYMAGWYAEHACENFYANLWTDPLLVKELASRLTASGAWQVAVLLAR